MSDMAELIIAEREDLINTNIRVVYPDYCTDVCVDDPSTPDEFECNAPEWCYQPYLEGRLTNQQFHMLTVEGVTLNLAGDVNVYRQLRYNEASDTVELWEAFGGVVEDPNPTYYKTYQWTTSEVQKMIAPGELLIEPRPMPTEYEIQPLPMPAPRPMIVRKLNDRWSIYGLEDDVHFIGRFTAEEWLRLQAGNVVTLVAAGESEQRELSAGAQIAKAPNNLPGYVIMVGGEIPYPPLLFPTAQIASENAPLSGDAVLSPLQIEDLSKGQRVFIDANNYYEYVAATDTLRLINANNGTVVTTGTLEDVGPAASGGSGIFLALAAVAVIASMSKK